MKNIYPNLSSNYFFKTMFHRFLRREEGLYTWDNLEKYTNLLPKLCQEFRLQLPDEKEATMILALLRYNRDHIPFPRCDHLIWSMKSICIYACSVVIDSPP